MEMRNFYGTSMTRFRVDDYNFMQTAPERATRDTGKKKSLPGPSSATEHIMASGFRVFHTKHVQDAAADEAEMLRKQRSVSSDLADVAGVKLSRTISGRRRRGDTRRASEVEIDVEGVPSNFGLNPGFAKRTNARKDIVPAHIIAAAKAIFNQGAYGGTKRSPDKAYEDLIPQMEKDWRSRLLVTPTRIKEWFSAWTTELKKSTRATAAARAESASDLLAVPDEQQADNIAAEIWRESQQDAIIAVAEEGLAASPSSLDEDPDLV